MTAYNMTDSEREYIRELREIITRSVEIITNRHNNEIIGLSRVVEAIMDKYSTEAVVEWIDDNKDELKKRIKMSLNKQAKKLVDDAAERIFSRKIDED